MQGNNWSMNCQICGSTYRATQDCPTCQDMKFFNFSCPECQHQIKVSETRCSNCKILLDWEEWSENQSVEKVVRVILESTYSELAIVPKMVLLYVAFVKYPGLLNSIYSMS